MNEAADAAPSETWNRLLRTWRGPLLAALIAFVAGLPGVFGLPPLDRDESRFAQATAQMLETGDFVDIRFQTEPRYKKPVGIHWMQAASVAVLSSAEARDIWAYRVPSLLGAMLAAGACAWGAAGVLGARTGLIAGAILGCTFLLSTEASIAKTDAMLCGATTLAMAALGRIYAAERGVGHAGRWTRVLMWAGLAVAILVKGPIGPMVFGLAVVALWIADRDVRWARSLGWSWGLALVLLVAGPWAVAVTVQTDGAFWGEAVTGDLAPKLAGGHERHGGPPGYHLAALSLLFFPATLLLPAAAKAAWRGWRTPGVRFALAWLVPAWLVFELSPTKLVHYPLPLYGALAWLAAAALAEPLGRKARWIGAGLSLLTGAVLAIAVGYLTAEYGDPSDAVAAVLASVLLAVAGVAGATVLLKGRSVRAFAAAAAIGVAAHGALAAALIPRLEPLKLSPRAAAALDRHDLDPREGLTSGPVEVAGYAEPSLVFLLGTATGLGDAPDAAAAVAEGRPAVVEGRVEPAFRAALAREGVAAEPVASIEGFDYSNGDDTRLTVYRRRERP